MVKHIFNLSEAADYTGFSKSHLYKLTHFKRVTHFKPNGKNIFFRKADLDAYMLKGEVQAVQQMDVQSEAAAYSLTSKAQPNGK